jgi:two-component system OmpR family response regulator
LTAVSDTTAKETGGLLAGNGDALNTVLVAEDDPDLRGRMVAYLESHGLVATVVDSVAAARAALRQNAYGGVILDWTLKGEDGLSIARDLMARGGPPVLITSSRSSEVDRVLALDMGADDYLVKPYGFRELLARLRAVQRRVTRPANQATGRHLARFDRWTVDLAAHRAMHEDGWQIGMTSGELSLLRAFLDNPNRVLYRHELLSLTRRDDAAVFDRTVDVLVSRLRRKLESDSTSPQLIQTVRGEGYLFTQSVEWSVT